MAERFEMEEINPDTNVYTNENVESETVFDENERRLTDDSLNDILRVLSDELSDVGPELFENLHLAVDADLDYLVYRLNTLNHKTDKTQEDIKAIRLLNKQIEERDSLINSFIEKFINSKDYVVLDKDIDFIDYRYNYKENSLTIIKKMVN